MTNKRRRLSPSDMPPLPSELSLCQWAAAHLPTATKSEPSSEETSSSPSPTSTSSTEAEKRQPFLQRALQAGRNLVAEIVGKRPSSDITLKKKKKKRRKKSHEPPPQANDSSSGHALASLAPQPGCSKCRFTGCSRCRALAFIGPAAAPSTDGAKRLAASPAVSQAPPTKRAKLSQALAPTPEASPRTCAPKAFASERSSMAAATSPSKAAAMASKATDTAAGAGAAAAGAAAAAAAATGGKAIAAGAKAPATAGTVSSASPRPASALRPPPASALRPVRCDRCDGQHASALCPHFKKARDSHPDAQPGRMLKGLGRSSGPPLLLRHGTVRPQPPDGSCLFHSLRFGLSRIAAARNVPTSTHGLRSHLARWVGAHASLRLADTPLSSWVQWDSGLSTQAYANRMERSGWGGGIEIAACSHSFAVNVWVYEKRRGNGGFERISTFDAPKTAPGSSAAGAVSLGLERTVHVLYKGGCHYDALLPDEGELAAFLDASPRQHTGAASGWCAQSAPPAMAPSSARQHHASGSGKGAAAGGKGGKGSPTGSPSRRGGNRFGKVPWQRR